MNRAILIFLLILLIPSCTSEKDFANKPNLKALITNNVEAKQIEELITVTRILSFESSPKALFGNAINVKVSPVNGDIFVGDFDSTRQLLRFSSTGAFLGTISKLGQGPGEHQEPVSFTVMQDGSILLLEPRKLMHFTKEGELIQSTEFHEHFCWEVVSLGEKIYLRVITTFAKEEPHALLVLDQNLKQIGQLGRFEKPLSQIRYPARPSLVTTSELIFITDFFDLGLRAFNTQDDLIYRHRFTSKNDEISQLLSKEHYSPSDKQEIKLGLHRFRSVFSDDEKLLFIESQRRSRHQSASLLYPDGSFFKLTGYDLFGTSEDGTAFPLHPLMGGSQGEFYFFIAEQDNLDRIKEKFPNVGDIQMKDTDNPVLVFFKFNDSWIRE